MIFPFGAAKESKHGKGWLRPGTRPKKTEGRPKAKAHWLNGVAWLAGRKATKKPNKLAPNPVNWVLRKLKRGQTYWDLAPRILGVGRVYIPNGKLAAHQAYMRRCAQRRVKQA